MKATEANLLSLISGPKQFVVPIYQRTYNWYLTQCTKLLQDIIRASRELNAPGHFVGSIVYFQENIQNTTGIPKLLLIDGQQRLTTVSLLVAALAHFIKEKGISIDTTPTKLQNYYLLNADEDGGLHFKLLLTRRDKETIKALIKGNPLPKDASLRVVENYAFFKEQINVENVAFIYSGIQRLFVVDVALERDKDNPQLIFESLNSTGLRLSQADLIRNFILMGQDVTIQTELYECFWHPMESSYGNEYSSIFDKFMRDYLSVKTGIIPNIDQVYDFFKNYVQSGKAPQNIHELVKDIYNFSCYYVDMVLHTVKGPKLKVLFKNLSKLQVAVSYPFLLAVFNDYSNKRLSIEDFGEILQLTENYVFRRAICGVPTNSLNKTFLTLYRNVVVDNYLESVKAAYQSLESYKRFPSDHEFLTAFVIKDVYNFRTRNYMLDKLENFRRKEPVAIDEYTIEHVMPQNQNLSSSWQTMLGENWKEVQERYLHTIGNITLTGYNSELSDRPFAFKKTAEGGFDHSPIRLNDYLRQVDLWSEDQIKERAQMLAEKALLVWHAPALERNVLIKYQSQDEQEFNKYSIDNFEHLRGDLLSTFEALRKRILNIDSSVKEEFKKLYIAYKSVTNFVDIVPQKARLRLSLNMDFKDIIDPKNLCKDITDLGRWGNGNVEFGVYEIKNLDYAMELIRQSFDRQMEES